MEQLTFQNPNEEKTLTLKGLEKQVNLKFKEYDNKIDALEKKLDILTRAIRGKYAK